jgi:cytidylate kinase
MAIITISRELGSMGSEIAQILEQKSKYRLIDKAILSADLFQQGISDMKKFDEKKPSLYNSFSSENYIYIHFLQSALYKFVEKGRCILLGRGGQYFFGDLPGTMKIHVIAPYKLRLQRIKVRFSCDSLKAEKTMQTSDRERSGFHNFFFNIDWQDSGLYDLVINTQHLSPKKAVEIIIDVLPAFDTKEIHQESRQMLDNIRMGQEIITNIFEKKKKIPVRYLREEFRRLRSHSGRRLFEQAGH